jgi:hypothetical protein
MASKGLPNLTNSIKDYIKSGTWKCRKSPRGAHYWIVDHNQMTCKHCNEKRPISVTFYSRINPKV